MMFQLFINELKVIRADIKNYDVSIASFSKSELPVIEWVPAMQRRRLSVLTKLALHCATQVKQFNQLPSIFSSRHGDLHKTVGLLQHLSEKQPLSPTSFSLSVHNAVAGQFSILTKNKAASSTISAGKDTFFMALVDGYARLKSGLEEQLLLVHCDQALPDVYQPYADEYQIDHAIAYSISLSPISAESSAICLEMDTEQSTDALISLPASLSFTDWFESGASSTKIVGDARTWRVSRV